MTREPLAGSSPAAASPVIAHVASSSGARADDSKERAEVRGRERLSVVVTTLDNAATLERCLAGVAWADEIGVLDSGSHDATLDIARRHGAHIFSEPFAGFGAQKQSAIDKASHDGCCCSMQTRASARMRAR